MTGSRRGPAKPAIQPLRPLLLLLGRDHSVLERFRQTKLHDGLGGNLNRRTGLRIATSTSLALGLHGLAEAGNDKLPSGLALLGRQGDELFHETCRDLLVNSRLFGQMRYHLRLRHHWAAPLLRSIFCVSYS